MAKMNSKGASARMYSYLSRICGRKVNQKALEAMFRLSAALRVKLREMSALSDAAPNRRGVLAAGMEPAMLRMTVRTCNCLVSRNILTVSMLRSTASEDLMKIKNFGRKCMVDVQEFLREVDNVV